MGKTTFMEQLRDSLQDRSVHLVKLGEYKGDPGAFANDLDACLISSTSSTPQTILLDGLDEAPDLAGSVLRKIRQLPDCVSVWIASRDNDAIRAIQTERPLLASYSLAPLSEPDLRTLAVHESVDADAFIQACERQGLLPICAKPLGCALALSVFSENNLDGVAQRDLWHRGIERLCDETPSPTRQLQGTPQFTLDEILHCSAWISLCLALTENHFVWCREQSHRTPHSLGISDLASVHFSSELIRTALKRGVFSPLGDGRVEYSHTMYRDYLAALGFMAFVPAEHWFPLLMNGQRTAVFPQRAGIVPWLATYNAGFLEELSGIQPELLLASVDSVQAIGPDRLCEALINRADGLSYSQRRDLSNLQGLNGGRTPDVLRTCLLDPAMGTAAIDLATRIVEACEYDELAGVLADRVLDVGLSLRERVDAAYAVCRLEDDAAKRKLKKLLPIDPAGDPQDDLRGTVLRACWPAQLVPDELVMHLTEPQKSSYGGAYSFFLISVLPASLETSLDEESAVVFLNWALNHIDKHEPYDFLGSLARTMYSICWTSTRTPAVTELLASGYIRALSVYRSPFLHRSYEGESMTSHILTRDAFLEDEHRRLAVLTAILSSGDIDSRQLGHIPFRDYPLYTQDDLPALFDRANADPTGPLVDQWAMCIKAVVSRANLDAYAGQVDRLHAQRPDLIDDSQKLRADMTAADRRADELEDKWRNEEEDRNRKYSDDQDRIDREIKDALQLPGLKSESFEWLSFWLNSKEGICSHMSIDIQQSPGWIKLTEEEQSAMLDLAHSYLADADIQPTPPNQHQYSVACALTALRLLRPSIYVSLPGETWQKCGVELLKAATHDNLELLTPLLDTLSAQYPDVATDAVLEVLSQELQRDFISIIGNWGHRLSDAQAQAILRIAADSTTDHGRRFHILSDLARHGKEGLVRTHLDSIFSSGWNVPPDSTMHKLRRLAFVLSPASYIRQLLDSLAADSDWGRQWIEASVGGHDNALLDALLACDMSDIAEMCIWLHEQYPPNTRPEHSRAYSPGPLDEIHMLKDHTINYLTQGGKDGSTAALQLIADRFPSEAWLKSCVLDAGTAEQASTAPVLPMAQIKELCQRKNASRRLVNTDQDLLQVTMTSLEAYRTYLQGDNPAIADLWNIEGPTRPRNEEYLSDHLKRYLDLSLKTDVVINREVQIRRKLFKDGASGSRTDIWVQATDEAGSVLTICIEVKCNWNRSSKTALKDQLVDKYMSGGTATAGILLLGWFACISWDESDNRLADSTATWSDSAEALADLDDQVYALREDGNNIRAIVLDCELR